MTTPRHQVSTAVARMRADADTVVDASMWSMDTATAAWTLIELTRLKAQVTEIEARVAAHADGLRVGEDVGATSAANWLAHTTKQTRPVAHGVVRLGHDLDRHPQTRGALAVGGLVVDQARVIIRAVDALPADLDTDLVAKAEAHLVAAAAHHDAKALTIIGRRLLEVVAPEQADAHEARLLEREEEIAAQACRLTMSDDGHGKTHGRFTIPTLQGAMLKKYLLALAAPKHLTATEQQAVANKPGPEKLGRAFCELIERVPANALPQVGGTDATIVVTIDLDTLMGRLEKVGVLDTGEPISPGQARRLACTAGIVPAVLGTRSEVLDLGRRARFYSRAQRTALGIRDQGCTAEGCDYPPGLTHAHHDQQWANGGLTDLHNGRLLCPRHHARAHDPAYEMTKLPGGKVAFHRRT